MVLDTFHHLGAHPPFLFIFFALFITLAPPFTLKTPSKIFFLSRRRLRDVGSAAICHRPELFVRNFLSVEMGPPHHSKNGDEKFYTTRRQVRFAAQ